MQWDEFFKKVDTQIAAKARPRERRQKERRQESVVVLQDRRQGDRRTGKDRRGRGRD